MGRKQNPVVGEYFERGPKLPDTSNRYEHTCKGCGENFPKGRFETLVSHLLKKCPVIPISQRKRLAIELHNVNNLIETPKPPLGIPTSQTNTFAVSTPASFEQRGTHNGLNILAEASKAYSRQTPYPQVPEPRSGPGAFDFAADVDDFARSVLNIPDDNVTTNGAGVSSDVRDAAPAGGLQSSTNQPNRERSLAPDSGLESIAASAHQMVAVDADIDLSEISIEEALLFSRSQEASPASKNGVVNQSLQQPPGHSTGVPFTLQQPSHLMPYKATELFERSLVPLRNIALHPTSHPTYFITESGTSERHKKPTTRSKFSKERRDEVQKIRKLGSCLRCRILKKTCSESDPCATCASIESPRIWKTRCVRTRLSKILTLFDNELPSIIAQKKAHDNSKIGAEAFDCRVEAFLPNETQNVLNFKALRRNVEDNTLHSRETSVERGYGFLSIDLDKEDGFLRKVEQYMTSTQPALLASETSTVLKATIHTAQVLLSQKTDSMLEGTLGLWTTILMLFDKKFEFQFIAHCGVLPGFASDKLNPGSGTPLLPIEWPRSCELLQHQLRAGVNSRAMRLAKAVMTELERRVMEKTTEDPFATFLATILLLNCIERVSWEYARYSDPVLRPKFPFPNKEPKDFLEQADDFLSIADGLLEMRGILPKLTVDLKSKIVVPDGEVDDVVRLWFDEIAVTREYIKMARDRPTITDDYRSLDGSLFSRLLRPYDPHASKGARASITN